MELIKLKMTSEPQTQTFYFEEYSIKNDCSCKAMYTKSSVELNNQVLSKLYGLTLTDGQLSAEDAKIYGMVSCADYGNENVTDWLNAVVGFAFKLKTKTTGEGDQATTTAETTTIDRESYFLVESMYLVVIETKKEGNSTKQRCHMYKLNDGKIQNGVIGFQVGGTGSSRTIPKIGLVDGRNKLIVGYACNNKLIIPPLSFYLEGRHEEVMTGVLRGKGGQGSEKRINLTNGYDMNKNTLVYTIPSLASN